MQESKEEVITFLKKIYLFSKLDDAQIRHLAQSMRVIRLPRRGERLFSEGEAATCFFVVMEGKIRLSTVRKRQRLDIGTLIPGDYFGEELLLDPVHRQTAVTAEPSTVLCLDKADLVSLLRAFPVIQDLVLAAAKSRRLARRRGFNWLGDNESVYLVERKHEFFLLLYLLAPIFLAVLSIPVIVWGLASLEPSWFLVGSGVLLAVVAVLVGIWLYLDWENDFYIVTSQRVVWLEKIILLYESRQEAPLNTILATNVVFNQVLRFLINYGTVIVRTYTGSIPFYRANHPERMIDYIKGLQSRASDIARQEEDRAMEALLRRRLNLPEVRETPPGAVPPPPAAPPRRSPGFLENFLKVRYQVGDVITYRKHWFILIQKTWLQILIGIILLAILAWGLSAGMVGVGASIFLMLLFFANFLWWLYHYVDWRNDVYVVTRDTILDIERKPLSREVKKSAPLGNILSLENKRVGILGLLHNFGTVIINIGTEEFNFTGVFNPSQVQYEIFDRMYALRRKKEEQEAARERERLADWLVLYHKQTESFEDHENNADEDFFSG